MQKFDYQIEDFMLYCQSKNLSKKTMESYEKSLKLFAKYLEDNFKVIDAEKVKVEMIRKYIAYLQERGKYTIVINEFSKDTNNPEARSDLGKKISITTINNYIRNIKVFFTYLENQVIVKNNPAKTVKQLKNSRKPQEFIDDESMMKLFRYIDTTKFHEFRDYEIIQIILDTGMRIGECLLITIDDLDINNRSILLRSDNTKNKKNRFVFFSPLMQQELRRWLQYKDRYVTSDFLFCTKRGTPLNVSDFETNFKKYAIRAGIPDAHPNQLRNNFAKRFLMAGGDIYTLSRLLGHSSVSVTEKAYLDLTDEDIRKNYQRFSPLSNLKKGGRR